jgi:hypothetical protein
MAQAKRKSSNGGNGSKTGKTEDAIALLKADHREVEGYFEAFEKHDLTIASRSWRRRSAKL